MIILYVGGVGSGKSISIMKEIVDRNRKCFVNFSTRHKKTVRLKVDDIITEEIVGYKQNGDPIKKKKVNWDFWNNLTKNGEEFDIYIDEAHNIMHSRRSMSTWNTLFTMWLSQIRKILGSSEKSNLYIITQRITGVDVSIRDLCHRIVYMKKIELPIRAWTKVYENKRQIKKALPVILIQKYYFNGGSCLDNFGTFIREEIKSYSYKSNFVANSYYYLYDSYELIEFGNGVYV